MNELQFDPMSMFEPYTPNRNIWLLFKVGSLKHITAMQRGLLYMNSLEYFTNLENENTEALRGDSSESLLAQICGGKAGKHYIEFRLIMREGDEKKNIDVSENTTVSVKAPNPENVMVFCFSALADDETGKIPGEANGELWLDERFLEFGTHMLLINNAKEFSSRISKAISNNPNLYSSKYFQGGYGLVEYIDLNHGSGNIGLFRKDKCYSWQREFRFILGARDETLNSKSALELQTGDISDISKISTLESFIQSPFKINRRVVKKVGTEYMDVEQEG